MGLFTDEELKKIALYPKRASNEEGTVVERDIKDITSGQQYQSINISKPPYGLRCAIIKPDGAVGRYR